MEERRKYKRIKKKTGAFRYESRYFFIIAVICLLLACGLSFITGRLPMPLAKSMGNQIEGLSIEEFRKIKKEIVPKVKEGDVENIINKYKEQSEGSR